MAYLDLNITEAQILQLQAFQTAEDFVGYWRLLADAGDRYAALALGVAQADTVPGRIARAFAQAVGVQTGGNSNLSGADWANISIDLMQADFARRQDQGAATNWHELDVSVIRTYHSAVFTPFGLPPDAWTAFAPTTLDPAQEDAVWEQLVSVGDPMLGATWKAYFNVSYTQLGALFTTPWSTYDPLIEANAWARIMETFRSDLHTRWQRPRNWRPASG